MATSGRTDGGAMRAMSSGIAVDAEVSAAWADIRATDAGGQGAVTWALFEIVPDASNPKQPVLQLVGKGSCSEEFWKTYDAKELKGKVVWGGVRAKSSGKFYGLMCVGDDVGGMAKGKASMHKNGVMNLLEGKSGEVAGNDIDEFREKLTEIVGEF